MGLVGALGAGPLHQPVSKYKSQIAVHHRQNKKKTKKQNHFHQVNLEDIIKMSKGESMLISTEPLVSSSHHAHVKRRKHIPTISYIQPENEAVWTKLVK